MFRKIFFLMLCTVFFSGPVFSFKGLYVNQFASILGHPAKEDSLLNYAYQHSFDYLALYQMHIVHADLDLTSVSGSQVLADFIIKAKTLYHIAEIGVCGENFYSFYNVIHPYNQLHPGVNEKVDVYNLEFEFWNPGAVDPGEYYCVTYLQPGGYSCDTAGAFDFYMDQLGRIDSLAAADGALTETYVGWFNAYQAQVFPAKTDRILLHSYVTNVNNTFGYAETRLEYLGAGTDTVNVAALFSSEPGYLGPFLLTHPEGEVFDIYLDNYTASAGAWKSHIHLIGYQWFTYTDMPYELLMGTEENAGSEMLLYPNPCQDVFSVQHGKDPEARVSVTDISGKQVYASAGGPVENISTAAWPAGIYYVLVETATGAVRKLLVRN